jgi:iron uptake system EfeUOB component EfeO/EfeM
MKRRFLIAAMLIVPCGAFAANEPVTVTVTAKGCEPAAVTVPAGETTFQIINKSARAMEWEILNGVMVVDERENIAPGFKQKMTTTLEPGEYTMTCGLLSNPTGRLTVTGAGAPAGPVRPDAAALIGPAAEYRVYLVGEANGLVKEADALIAVLKSSDKAKAGETLKSAQSHFDRMRPAFAGCDATAAFVDLGVKLRAKLAANSAPGDLAPKVERFQGGAKALQGRVSTSKFSAAAMVKGAATTLADLPKADPSVDRKAVLDGVRRVIELMQPLLAKADGGLEAQLKADFAALDAALERADNAAAETALKTLTADAAKLTPALGLE